MFKKLRNHDKSKTKSGSSIPTTTSTSTTTSTPSTRQPSSSQQHQHQHQQQEKESPQHIENATDDNASAHQYLNDDERLRAMMNLDEDPNDLLPFNHEDPNLPFGDGANKIFGMENFGNTCYCNSILQVLYYTTDFRKAVLRFPERDPEHFRKRRLHVPGNKIHGFVQANLNNQQFDDNSADSPQQQQQQQQQQSQSHHHHESDEGKPEKKKGLFGKSKNKSSSSSSNGTSTATTTTASTPNGTTTSNGISNGNGSASHYENGSNSQNNGNTTNGDLNNSNNAPSIPSDPNAPPQFPGPHLIDKNIVNKYPALKTIKPVYQLNQQRTLSILGDTEDPNANVERRKRHALMTGPIINLDHAYNKTYSMAQVNLFSTLKDIFECMVENKSQVGIVSPQKLIEVLKKENELFRSSMHQDAHEFLNFLVNSVLEVVDEYDSSAAAAAANGTTATGSGQATQTNQITQQMRKMSLNAEKSAIHDIFEGLLTSETKCLCCETVSTRDEKFLDLSIDLTASSSVTSCLKQFSQSEMLQEQNKFYCDSCHSLQEAAKMIKLKKLPKILALHLKRFKYSEEFNRNMKLFHRVTYPKNLRLFNTTQDTETPDKLYQLYAVVVHIGGGPHHGHYVSLIKTENFGWLLFDDEAVESIDENYVFKFFGDGPGLATAYVLFYKETDELSNMKNNLFSGLDDNEETTTTTTLDLNFNQVNGNLNERLEVPEPVIPKKPVDEIPHARIMPEEQEPQQQKTQTQQQQTPQQQDSGNEKRRTKMFGWKK